MSLTHQPGDATRAARRAVESGCDLVLGYGGDGTQMEVVNGLMGTDVPLAILPGGTGNAMAFELGIPRDLREAAQLVCQSRKTSGLDLARVRDRVFMLRAYTGPRSEQAASREEKDRFGLLAYPLAALRILTSLQPTRYRLVVDNQEWVEEGLMCFVFNAGSAGGIPAGLRSVSAQDGRLDVFVLDRETPLTQAVAQSLLDQPPPQLNHRQGRVITIEAEPPQPLWLDGEASGSTPCTIEALPAAIQVVTP